jgi:hypothetical protein
MCQISSHTSKGFGPEMIHNGNCGCIRRIQGLSLNVFAGRVFPFRRDDGRNPRFYAATSTSAIILMNRRGSTGLTRN